MGLIGNYSVLHKSLARFTNGTATAGAYAGNVRAAFNNPSLLRSRDVYWPAITAYPEGYAPGTAHIIPRSSGGIASHTQISGMSSIDATLWEVKLTVAALSGSGTITEAALSLLSPATADLTGVGSISADLQSVSNMIAALTGSGTISDANLSAIVPMSADLSGSASLSVELKGYGSLSADILPFSTLSPEGLAASLMDNNDIETGYSLREALKLILASVAGKLSGAGTATITIRNVPDDKDRIVATVDSNGNRTSVTYDVS